jgi:hypothetical protein
VSKRTILFLSIGAIVFYIVWVVAFTAAAANCAPATAGGTASCTAGAAGGAVIALLAFLVGAVLTFVAWLLGLIKTARMSRWGWFVVVLLLSPLGSLIYGLAGPEA